MPLVKPKKVIAAKNYFFIRTQVLNIKESQVTELLFYLHPDFDLNLYND